MAHMPGPAALTLPGYMDLPLDTRDVTASCHYQPSEHGQVAAAALILGESGPDGPVRAVSRDPQYWRRIEAAARECASFLEEARRSAAA